MPLTKCWSCGHSVSTGAHFCPNADCVVPRPWDPAARFELVEASGSAAPSDPKARIEGLAKELIKLHEKRSEKAALTAEVTCSECKAKLKLSEVLGSPCPQCGDPWVIVCEMPGAHCHQPPTQVARVSGKWMVICGKHKVCEHCEVLIDESRFESRTRGAQPVGVAPPGTQGAGSFSRNSRERNHRHADRVVCKAMEIVKARFG